MGSHHLKLDFMERACDTVSGACHGRIEYAVYFFVSIATAIPQHNLLRKVVAIRDLGSPFSARGFLTAPCVSLYAFLSA